MDEAAGGASGRAGVVGRDDRRCDVVVVGGGVIGLTVAWRLARAGRSVILLERRGLVEVTSRASAAMITPLGYDAALPDDAMALLRVDSSRLWRSFAAELAEESGTDPGFRVPGCVLAAFDDAGLGRLEELRHYYERHGEDASVLDGATAREIEPALSGQATGALHVPEEACVDPERLRDALREAIGRAGGEIWEGHPAVEVLAGDGVVAGVRTADGGRVLAGTTVLAAGAWSGLVAGVPAGARLELRAVKGQSVVFDTRGVAGGALHTVLRGFVNLVPRSNGRVIAAGTIEEDAGLDVRPTAGGLLDVIDRAVRSAPRLAECAFAGCHVGLRPVTGDGWPVLGPSPVEGLWYAAGHSAFGMQLAPITAELTARAMAGDKGAAARLRPFALERFESSPDRSERPRREAAGQADDGGGR